VFWWENLTETHHLKDLGIDGSIILKLIFKSELIWLRIETSGRLL
jgi:hypothetical protein